MAEENNTNQSNTNDDPNVTQGGETNDTSNQNQNSDGENQANEAQAQADANDARLKRLEEGMERILGEISSIREAQGIMVENGAVISESTNEFDTDRDDDFVPPSEMDLLI